MFFWWKNLFTTQKLIRMSFLFCQIGQILHNNQWGASSNAACRRCPAAPSILPKCGGAIATPAPLYWRPWLLILMYQSDNFGNSQLYGLIKLRFKTCGRFITFFVFWSLWPKKGKKQLSCLFIIYKKFCILPDLFWLKWKFFKGNKKWQLFFSKTKNEMNRTFWTDKPKLLIYIQNDIV